MNIHDIDILVMDGDAVVQRWPCTRTTMPDGSEGVIWRGVAYKLMPGDKINVAAEADPQGANAHYAILPGEEASWVLVAGLEGILTRSVLALHQRGFQVTRSGRWLGEPVGGVSYDWFICCDGLIDSDLLAATLGKPPQSAADDLPAKLAILEQRMADLVAELKRARTPPPPVDPGPLAAPSIHPDAVQVAALASALSTIQSLQQEIAALRDEKETVAPAPGSRLEDELADVLAALRPDIVLLRSSWRIAIGEFRSRSAFWRTISELPQGGGRPTGWKPVQSVERWWERHVSDGQDNTGRAYARFNAGTRQWELLLSWKGDQGRDMEWLRKRA